jgi:hypothetical protein
MTTPSWNKNGVKSLAGRPEMQVRTNVQRKMIEPVARNFSSLPKIVLVYPCRSLIDQLRIWADRCKSRQSSIAIEESPPSLCIRDCPPDFIVVDATENPAKAADALMQIVDAFGEECVTMYTEIMHEGLETLVRPMGVSLLLGPMNILEWNGYFDRKFSAIEPLTEERIYAGDLLRD